MTERRLIRLPGEPEEAAVDVTEGSEQEFRELDHVKVTDPKLGGVEMDAWETRKAEWIERNFDDPGTLVDEPVPFDFWRAVADFITIQIKSTTSIGLRTSRDFARKWCQSLYKQKVNAMTPQRAQMDLNDMLRLSSPTAETDQETMRCFRISCYRTFQKEYLGRLVG